MKNIVDFLFENKEEIIEEAKLTPAKAKMLIKQLCDMDVSNMSPLDEPEDNVTVGPNGLEIKCNAAERIELEIDKPRCPQFQIAKFDGEPNAAFRLQRCDCKDFKGLFAPNCEFNGDLAIRWNDNLTSFEGLPEKVNGCVSVRHNINIKSLEGLPKECEEFYFRYDTDFQPTEEEIRKYLKTKNIPITIADYQGFPINN